VIVLESMLISHLFLSSPICIEQRNASHQMVGFVPAQSMHTCNA
jgi:hypothetical protein